MAQRRRSITFAHAHRLSIAAALLIPPLVAYAPEHCQLAACLLGSFLIGLVGLAYRVAFQVEHARSRQTTAHQVADYLEAVASQLVDPAESTGQRPGASGRPQHGD